MGRDAEVPVDIVFHPIGFIYSPFESLEAMPIQPTSYASAAGRVELLPDYGEGLRDLEGFSHVYLIYYCHAARRVELTVTPFLDTEPRGIFATRAPLRPNPIGLSLVKLVRVEGLVLYVDGVDVLNGTPLLDIKPYVPDFEPQGEVRIGWLAQARARLRAQRSDDRFT